MEGTQIPTNSASIFSPWKYIISENTNDKSAAASMIISARENFLNIVSRF